MNNTKIEWTDLSWNPVSGCLNSCPYCYAKSIYKRFGRSFKPEFHNDRLFEPFYINKPHKIFVCSVADLFGEWVPEKWIQDILYVVNECPQHTFQFLTKNPKRYLKFNFSKNCWLGATATDQKMFDNANNILKTITNNIVFLSCEPLLDRINAENIMVNWLIIGAQTGKKPFQPPKKWVLDLTNSGKRINCAIFYKPNLTGYSYLPKEFPNQSEQLSLL